MVAVFASLQYISYCQHSALSTCQQLRQFGECGWCRCPYSQPPSPWLRQNELLLSHSCTGDSWEEAEHWAPGLPLPLQSPQGLGICNWPFFPQEGRGQGRRPQPTFLWGWNYGKKSGKKGFSGNAMCLSDPVTNSHESLFLKGFQMVWGADVWRLGHCSSE